MTTSHTPGPWEYLAEEEEGLGGAITAKTGWICHFYTDPSPANARLIAAAPDLLDALRIAVDTPELQGGKWEELARAAIQKAEGKA